MFKHGGTPVLVVALVVLVALASFSTLLQQKRTGDAIGDHSTVSHQIFRTVEQEIDDWCSDWQPEIRPGRRLKNVLCTG